MWRAINGFEKQVIGGKKVYKTEVIKSCRKIEDRAKKIENKINEMESLGFEFVSVCSTPNFGAILVFKKLNS